MGLKYYLQRIKSLPPEVLIKKGMGKICRELEVLKRRQIDRILSTYMKSVPFHCTKLNSYFSLASTNFFSRQTEQTAKLAEYYFNHRFNLLGSGWVQVKHGMHCRGLEEYRYDMGRNIDVDSEGCWLEGRINPANLPESKRIWHLVDQGYVPIDWHLDFKSGYRWSEDTWYLDIPYGHKPGVDIKVPWELARMQHLPQLVWAYALTKEKRVGIKQPQLYAREFRNQVLDFIATNPPRFGVNWRCTMDVAIRIANWLLTYDLFRNYGEKFDDKFNAVFFRSIYEHGSHIINNLEWSQELRGNHYLSDIVGLLFVSAFLPSTPDTEMWLAFAVNELINEVELQFCPDGSNFEASTSYHRLSAELVVYATALVLGLPQEKQAAFNKYNHRFLKVRPRLKLAPITLYHLSDQDRLTPFPAWYFERLEKMAEFTMHITKPNGKIPQIGDNDSGRLFKLQPTYRLMTVAEAKSSYANLDGYSELPDEAEYWDEEHLDHRHLVAAINGLFNREDFTDFSGKSWLEKELVRCLARGFCLPNYLRNNESITAAEKVRIGTKNDWKRLKERLDLLPDEQQRILEIPISGGDLRENSKLYSYPNFGLYIYKTKRLYLALRCGPIGQNGYGGHAHNDQLSIELNVDGVDWITDPGTYLYTPLPKRRNEYRSVKAHFAPQVKGREPGCLNLGLFQLGNEAKSKCLYFGCEGFISMHQGYGIPIYRLVQVLEQGLRITDYVVESASPNIAENLVVPSISGSKSTTLSNSYGVKYA
ncbi:MAG: Heparin-sulfate lyase precursor [Pelotomaculum sp. PtaB.Bin104]|nr:MAG: Heparin-sulfate lyase precursor [Pelotomaculum sp. PtaB.Bin104]